MFSLVQLFDLEKREMLRVVRVNDALLINHTSHILGHKLYTVGGGGNLFSFGTCFNSRVKIYSVQGTVITHYIQILLLIVTTHFCPRHFGPEITVFLGRKLLFLGRVLGRKLLCFWGGNYCVFKPRFGAGITVFWAEITMFLGRVLGRK